MIRSAQCTLTKQTIGLVGRRASTKQQSIALDARSCLHRWAGLFTDGDVLNY